MTRDGPLNGQGRETGVNEEKCEKRMVKRDFVTRVLMNVEHSVVHRPRIGEGVKPNKERKEPRQWGPSDKTITIRSEGTSVQVCGDNIVADKWINGHSRWEGSTDDQVAQSKKTLHLWWKRSVAYPV